MNQDQLTKRTNYLLSIGMDPIDVAELTVNQIYTLYTLHVRIDARVLPESIVNEEFEEAV